MKSLTEIVDFVKKEIDVKDVKPDSDIEYDFGCYGDDFHEFIEKYSTSFDVDMTTYLWYFHTGEEGIPGLGSLFFKPPNKRVTRIPVTPKMLLEIAEEKKWNISYPNHKIPKKRNDILINQIIVILFLTVLICYWLLK